MSLMHPGLLRCEQSEPRQAYGNQLPCHVMLIVFFFWCFSSLFHDKYLEIGEWETGLVCVNLLVRFYG